MPTVTLTPAVGSDDGWVRGESPTYGAFIPTEANTTNTAHNTLRSFVSGTHYVDNYLVRFDTSVIPDGATVITATLRLYFDSSSTVDSRSFVAGYYAGTNWPITVADLTGVAETTAHGGTALGTTGWNEFVLASPAANFNLSGYTGFRCMVSGGEPTGQNQFQVQSYEGTNPPQLVVSYMLKGYSMMI